MQQQQPIAKEKCNSIIKAHVSGYKCLSISFHLCVVSIPVSPVASASIFLFFQWVFSHSQLIPQTTTVRAAPVIIWPPVCYLTLTLSLGSIRSTIIIRLIQLALIKSDWIGSAQIRSVATCQRKQKASIWYELQANHALSRQATFDFYQNWTRSLYQSFSYSHGQNIGIRSFADASVLPVTWAAIAPDCVHRSSVYVCVSGSYPMN